MEKLITDAVNTLAARYDLSRIPGQSVSKLVVKAELTCRKTELFTLSVLEVRAAIAGVKGEVLVLTPVLKDAPAALCGYMHAPGHDSIHLDALDDLVGRGQDLSYLEEAKKVRGGLAEQVSSLNWYEDKKLPCSVCVHAGAEDPYARVLFASWLNAWCTVLESAPVCDPDKKREKTAELVNAVSRENASLKTVYTFLSKEHVDKLIRCAFLP